MTAAYHPSQRAYDTPPASYWRDSAGAWSPPPTALPRRAEVAVIGGGYTGLSAALELARAGRDVLVIEAAFVGWGASGRNGGFCCLGSSMHDHETLARRYGDVRAGGFRRAQHDAIGHVRRLILGEGIECDIAGEGELELAHGRRQWRRMQRESGHEDGARLLDRADLRREGYAISGVYGGRHIRAGFGLHPLKYAHGLGRAVLAAGGRISEACPVLAVTPVAGGYELQTAQGIVRAEKVVLAGNGYTPRGLRRETDQGLLPVLSSIVVTRPLTPAEIAAQGWSGETMAYDSRYLLHYFRLLPDKRLLMGGRGGLSGAPGEARHIRRRLQQQIGRYFPAWRHVPVTHFWQGFICLARDLLPHAGVFAGGGGFFHALAYHGNGVAMASWLGARIGQVAAGTLALDEAVPALLRRPLPAFPFPCLRKAYLRGAYGWYRLADWFG